MIDLRTELELLIATCRADGVSSAAEVGHILALFEERGLKITGKPEDGLIGNDARLWWGAQPTFPSIEGSEDGCE